MHNAISDITIFDNRDVDWLVSRIKTKLTAETFALDFFAFSAQFLQGMNEGTARTYQTALNAFKRFLKRDSIDINDITKKLLVEFVEFCDKEPKMAKNKHTGEYKETKKTKRKGLASATYLSKLSTIFKAAKAKYNDDDEDVVLIPRSPFDTIRVDIPNAEGQDAIPKEVVQLMIQDTTPKAKNGHRYALDAFIVSFGLMGINMADLFEATPPKNGMLVYNRCKTKERRPDGAEMQVRVPDCLLPYLERLGAGTDSKVWLPELRRTSQDRKIVTSRINRCIKSWCEANKVKRFTTYGIRKAWATLARSTGADKSLVDECIGHTGDYKMTDIYASRPWDKMAELNEKVLNMFEWKREE
jgi:site-specific recombinase XerD